MITVYKMIARVAETDSTILLEGESGTGKELVARAIHANSLRRAGPFVAVDSGALAESLLESELFGHERGAFTGAVASKKGLLEKAHGGTCFLDEIADISPVLQSKLPRVLQEREIRRVGRTEPLAVDVRIIAASNKNLKALVDAGKFREDLYYRLNVVTITIPPLRDRSEDVPLLAHFFARKYAEAQGKPPVQIAPEAMALLIRYSWPGNVRELEHVIERAVALSPCPVILPAHLPDVLQMPPPDNGERGWRTLAQLEHDYILRVLEAHHRDLGRAARVLGIHRKTLQRKLRRYERPEAGLPGETCAARLDESV
jgi:transcriptional regulator with PAS, ATPase and Fis domain